MSVFFCRSKSMQVKFSCDKLPSNLQTLYHFTGTDRTNRKHQSTGNEWRGFNSPEATWAREPNVSLNTLNASFPRGSSDSFIWTRVSGAKTPGRTGKKHGDPVRTKSGWTPGTEARTCRQSVLKLQNDVCSPVRKSNTHASHVIWMTCTAMFVYWTQTC